MSKRTRNKRRLRSVTTARTHAEWRARGTRKRRARIFVHATFLFLLVCEASVFVFEAAIMGGYSLAQLIAFMVPAVGAMKVYEGSSGGRWLLVGAELVLSMLGVFFVTRGHPYSLLWWSGILQTASRSASALALSMPIVDTFMQHQRARKR